MNATSLFRFAAAASCAALVFGAFVSPAGACDHAVRSDFTGDNRSDVAIYDSASGMWYFRQADGSASQLPLSIQYAVPAPVDLDLDGKCDLAVFSGAQGIWRVLFTVIEGYIDIPGIVGAIPIPGDYDGDGTAQLALYSGKARSWFIYTGAVGGVVQGDTTYRRVNFSKLRGIPLIGDFDGDCKLDLCMVQSGNAWTVLLSSTGQQVKFKVGPKGGIPFVGDFDGDGYSDAGSYDGGHGSWVIQLGGNAGTMTHAAGYAGTLPVIGDYDGDGKADFVLYDPLTGQWYFEYSQGGYASFTFGYYGAVAVGSGK